MNSAAPEVLLFDVGNVLIEVDFARVTAAWAAAAGVPAEAVRDFLLGHLRIQIAVLFGEVNGTFSDAAYKISRRAKPIVFKEGWERIFELADIREQVRDITAAK